MWMVNGVVALGVSSSWFGFGGPPFQSLPYDSRLWSFIRTLISITVLSGCSNSATFTVALSVACRNRFPPTLPTLAERLRPFPFPAPDAWDWDADAADAALVPLLAREPSSILGLVLWRCVYTTGGVSVCVSGVVGLCWAGHGLLVLDTKGYIV